MKPMIWCGGTLWFVSRPKNLGWGWQLTVWPGTEAMGYPSLADAMDATLAALTTVPS